MAEEAGLAGGRRPQRAAPGRAASARRNGPWPGTAPCVSRDRASARAERWPTGCGATVTMPRSSEAPWSGCGRGDYLDDDASLRPSRRRSGRGGWGPRRIAADLARKGVERGLSTSAGAGRGGGRRRGRDASRGLVRLVRRRFGRSGGGSRRRPPPGERVSCQRRGHDWDAIERILAAVGQPTEDLAEPTSFAEGDVQSDASGDDGLPADAGAVHRRVPSLTLSTGRRYTSLVCDDRSIVLDVLHVAVTFLHNADALDIAEGATVDLGRDADRSDSGRLPRMAHSVLCASPVREWPLLKCAWPGGARLFYARPVFVPRHAPVQALVNWERDVEVETG